MKILHTSDWHIGRKLHEKERFDELQKFFSWLESVIEHENINALFVSGDIFDNNTPSNQSREIYYSFLARVVKSSCRHIVIIAGNHDSPYFLDAPAKPLELLDVHVIGQANIDDEVITLNDPNGNPEMIVCAVPFLRDRDVRTARPDDDISDRQQALLTGIADHYKNVFSKALELKGDLKIPLVATGHMFVKGGKVRDGEEARELYVGTVIKVGLEIFPSFVNYVALGHLHSRQGNSRIHYCGSPFPMTFGEANHTKYVTIVDFDENCRAKTVDYEVPVFRKLIRVKGDWKSIDAKLTEIISLGEPAWLEITYTGDELIDIKERVTKKLKLFPELEALSFYNETLENSNNNYDSDSMIIGGNLDEISPEEIFKLKLEASKVPEEQRSVLMEMYREILHGIDNQ